ncbi:hypothetical protein [Rhodopirellula sp. SWK7]|uniref:hypothetical protein n=1 Tax=Rhodopirellula sp. SWK7 TaxID=595460 RepID=UPI001181C44B|nr:hypothetical protein [Rhodopirellula sp. SWK7]
MLLAEFPWQVFMTPFGIPIVAIVCVFTWLAIQSISIAVAKVMCNRSDMELKMELLARGFTSEEIARTVEAGRTEAPPRQGCGSGATRHAAI